MFTTGTWDLPWESDGKCLFKINNKNTKANNKSTITM